MSCDFDTINSKNDFFSKLPVEICYEIFNFVTFKDLLSCSQVCVRWNSLCNDNSVWHKKCQEIKIPNLPNYQDLSSVKVPLKHLYLEYALLLSNWQCDSRIEPITVHVHEDHIVTGLALLDSWVVSCSDDGSIAVVDLISGEKLHSLRGHVGGVWSLVALTVAGQPVVATSGTDCNVRVWCVVSGKCMLVLRGHENTVRCLAASPADNTGRQAMLISGSRDSNLRVWNVVTGRCVHLLSGHDGAIRCIRSDVTRVVSGSYDNTVRVWDLQTGLCLFVLSGHTDRVFTLYLGTRYILSASLDTTMRLWDLVTGMCLHVLVGHRSLTSDMAMTTDEKLVVSGNADQSVKVWCVSSGICIREVGVGHNFHMSAVTSVQVVLDRFVVSSSTDGTVKLWSLSDGKFIRDIVPLDPASKTNVVWRSISTNDRLVCATGTGYGSEPTRLVLYDFSVKYFPWKHCS